MLDVQLDRFDHQIESIRTIDLACNAISSFGSEARAFGEVEQAIYALSVAVQHEEHCAVAVFHAREQEQMIGAEVEHGRKENESGSASSRPLSAPLRGYPPDSSGSGYHHSAAHGCELGGYAAGGFGFLLALRRLSPPSRNTSEFSTKRSAMAVAMVVL